MTLRSDCDPMAVRCSGEGLSFGYITYPIEFLVDTRNAGSGELTVYCDGPHRKAFCELKDNHNGTFTVELNAQDTGCHKLHVQYGGMEALGSPFNLRVSAAGYVRAHGRGLDDGLISRATGQFVIDTQEAGPGEIKVRVGGPRGHFRIETQKHGKKLLCRYNPRFAGMYEIEAYWQGDHVPGSPFHVYLCKTEEELKHHITMASINAHHHRTVGAHHDEFGSLFDGGSVR